MLFNKKDGKYVLELSEKEYSKLGLDKIGNFEIIGIKNKFWVLLPSSKKEQKKESALSRTESNLILKLSTKNWADLVVGKFEKNLSKEEKALLEKWLKTGKVIKLQKKPKYKKPIYQLSEKKQKQKQKTSSSFFFATKSQNEAQRFSEENKELIQTSQIRGIKDFDGTIYFVSSVLIEKLSPKILSLLPSNLSSLSEELKQDSALIKAILCFLAEEGRIYQPEKDIFHRVD